MNWLGFAAAVIGHIAWPVVVLVVLIALRKHLGALAERILELSFGGATFKFDKLLTQGKEIVDSAAPADIEPKSSKAELTLPMPDGPETIDVSKLRFTKSIFTVFDTVERILSQIGDAIGVKARGLTLVRVLITRDLISDEFLYLYKTLREAREAVSLHGAMPTSAQVEEYNRQAFYLLESLEVALKRLPKDKQTKTASP